MKPSLQFRLSQHLTLTPQLQQSIRLLQLSTVELNQEIDRILMENPALEREDIEEGERSFATPDTPTLRDHLHAQLSLTNLSARDRGFVALLIDALDDDGYLTQSLEEIAALLPPEAEAAPEELSIALRHLQHFEPAGVGARSPSECLCLQLKTLPEEPARRLALEIAEKH